MNIKFELRKRLITEEAGHEYGCVMLFLPIEKGWWDKITKYIKPDDLYTEEGDRSYGLLPHTKAHVTLLYGIHDNVSNEDVEAIISTIEPSEIKLSKIDFFDNSKKGFDVIKFKIESDSLTKMNKMFKKLPNTNEYPTYHPHVTIAYVKAGKGKEYSKKLSKDEELSIMPDKVVYDNAKGIEKDYPINKKDGKNK